MKELQLHFTIFLLKKFKSLMRRGLDTPFTISDKIWKAVITKNLFKVKAPEAACGCYEKSE